MSCRALSVKAPFALPLLFNKKDTKLTMDSHVGRKLEFWLQNWKENVSASFSLPKIFEEWSGTRWKWSIPAFQVTCVVLHKYYGKFHTKFSWIYFFVCVCIYVFRVTLLPLPSNPGFCIFYSIYLCRERPGRKMLHEIRTCKGLFCKQNHTQPSPCRKLYCQIKESHITAGSRVMHMHPEIFWSLCSQSVIMMREMQIILFYNISWASKAFNSM